MTSKERFEQLSLPHLEAMYRLAMRLSGNEAEAEDLVQEALYRAYRAFGGFQLRDYGAKPWLLRILHNVFYTRRGREAKQPTLLDDVDLDHFPGVTPIGGSAVPSDENPDESSPSINWEDVDQEVMRAVQGLAPEYRSVLLLWALEGLSYKEIAEVCNCAIGTVMSRLHRARQALGGTLACYAEERNFTRSKVRPA
jgi:RNA polymerase sigma-70 factor (ECF subfamily)